MLKKLLIASVLAVTSTAALAAQGPYLGASVGIDNTPFKMTVGDATIQAGSRGAAGTVFGGYGANLSPCLYLGGEVFAGYSGTNTKAISEAGDEGYISLRKKFSYGASVLPGVMIGERTMAYGRVGFVRTNFDYSVTGVGSKSRTVTGGQLGAGVQTSLTPCLDVRGEYVYTRYQKFNAISTSIKPSSDQVNLGLVYNIG